MRQAAQARQVARTRLRGHGCADTAARTRLSGHPEGGVRAVRKVPVHDPGEFAGSDDANSPRYAAPPRPGMTPETRRAAVTAEAARAHQSAARAHQSAARA